MSAPLDARTRHVDELVGAVLAGRIRIPRFQRGMRWTGEDVRLLLDSIWRGFPVGTLLLWERPGAAGRHRVGPLVIDLPADDRAWWVVDGQQRLASLAAALHHPDVEPVDPEDPFAAWFDPDADRFVPPRRDGVPRTWIPLGRLGDPAGFLRWLAAWEPGRRRPELIEAATRLQTRLRDYRVPVYLVQEDDEQVVREIFHRVNDAGHRLRYHEVFDALLGSPDDEAPGTDELAAILDDRTGFGRLEPDLVAQCALALAGHDPGRPPPWARIGRAPEPWRRALRDLRPALEAALAFVVDELGVPHERLLPHRRIPLVALAVYFHRFAQPAPNARRILRRWFWRGTLALHFASGNRFRMRDALAAARTEGHDDQVALALLRTVPSRPAWTLPERFDARSARSRIALLAMARARPRDPDTGRPFAIQPAFADPGAAPWGLLVRGRWRPGQAPPLAGSAANRLLLPPGSTERLLVRALERLARTEPDSPVLASHLVAPEAARAWREGDLDRFLACRASRLVAQVERMGDAFAEWRHPSRPSIAHLLAPSRATA